MPLAITIKKDEMRGAKEKVRNNLKIGALSKNQQSIVDTAKGMFDDWYNGVQTLQGMGQEWVKEYKEDLKAIGVRNVGDFVKWVGLNIAGAAVAVFSGKLIGMVVGGAVGALGTFAASTIGFMTAITLQPVVTPILQSGIQATGQILNFNIMQTDDELWKQVEEKVNGLYGLLGTTVGSAMGWLVCGALPNSVMFRFNPAVAAAIAQDLNPDARAEMYGYIAQIVRITSQTVINSEMVNRFTSLRRELKRDPNTDFAKFVRSVIGEENFKKWGDANQQPWTIKKNVIDAQIDKEQDPNWKSFYQNSLEGFTDACIEASFIIANNLDTYIAAQKIARSSTLGRVQAVRIRLGGQVQAALNNEQGRSFRPV
ncbi:hypothetical protein CAL7716_043940 [Calothrix sp. PCC 7716]|nr:hypothetical protein CAL7716_043940 [Calothrix sp. PCC 7716]